MGLRTSRDSPLATGLQKSSWHRPLWVSERPASMSRRHIQIVESHLSHLSFVICHVSHSRLCLYSARIARHAAIQSLAGLRRIFPERFHPRNPGCRGQCRCQQRTKDAAKHLSAESAVLKLSVNWLQQIIIRTDHSPTSSQNQYSQ